jgi:hypothetical protein
MKVANMNILDEFLNGRDWTNGVSRNLLFFMKNYGFWEFNVKYSITWENMVWFQNYFAWGLTEGYAS